jgi:hypothetical protein
MARTLTPAKADKGVSNEQAPATGGSPCCQANIHDAQSLWTARTYRACGACGREV